MKKGVVCISVVLFVILAVAVITDMVFDKIYNEWICLAVMTGLSYAAWMGGPGGLVRALLSMALPVALLYPLFLIGGLGAGDIKLLAAAGCFLDVGETAACLGISFCIGAVFSLLKMLAERSLLRRMQYLLSYVRESAVSGDWKRYGQGENGTGKIHFALPVLLGVILYQVYQGGMVW